MTRIRLTGYADRLSAMPGETVHFMLSAEGTAEADVDLVRIIHGDQHPDGPGFIEELVPGPWSPRIAVRKQFIQLGNFVLVDDPDNRLMLDDSFTLHAFVFPTTLGGRRQVILGRWDQAAGQGAALGIDRQGRLEFWVGDGVTMDAAAADVALLARSWYFVAAAYDRRDGRVTLVQRRIVTPYNGTLGPVAPFKADTTVEQTLRVKPVSPATQFMWAGASDDALERGRHVTMMFNGKIDRSGVLAGAASRHELDVMAHGDEAPADSVLAAWDTTAGYSPTGVGDTIIDLGPHGLHGRGVNRPVRAMTGWNWDGGIQDFRVRPDQHGGIAFHDDALTDCHWDPTWTIDLPTDLRSGVYAARLRAGDREDHVPFIVRPRTPTARIALLVPTNSYLAYANESIAFDVPVAQVITGHTPILSESDVDFYQNPEYGKSTYDHHTDGEGVCYSSARRPILNFRPRFRSAAIGTTWQFGRDLSIIAWLEAKGHQYDCITDQDLHREGRSLLDPYSVVLTGSHPEYHSERMLDSIEQYVAGGGRLMYLGGNGFYWVVSFADDEPWCMEVRKGEAGTRAWQTRPGEQHHATSGERGGLWRLRGRPPQQLTGVGFTAEGFDMCTYYERMPDSFHRSVAWIMDGVGADERIGDFGLALGGAAGLEVERYDLTLGTPPHTKLLASGFGFSDSYLKAHEDILFNHVGLGGTQDFQVRADMTYFTAPNDGAVFSTGSIAWSSALPANGFDNNVSRVTDNVLRAFERAGPLPGHQFVEDEKLWR